MRVCLYCCLVFCYLFLAVEFLLGFGCVAPLCILFASQHFWPHPPSPAPVGEGAVLRILNRLYLATTSTFVLCCAFSKSLKTISLSGKRGLCHDGPD